MTVLARNWQKFALGLTVLACLGLDGFIVYEDLVQLKGTSFDFYLVWVGAREIWQGHNPYTTQVAEQIQLALIGHRASPSENQYIYPYPPYLAIIIVPFLILPFAASVTAWLVLQQVLLALAFILMMQTLDWRPATWMLGALVAAWVAFRYSVLIMLLGQTSVLIL